MTNNNDQPYPGDYETDIAWAGEKERPTVQESLDAEVRRHAFRVAEAMRRSADRIEQLSTRTIKEQRDAGAIADDIMSEMRSFHGNLTALDQLVLASADADIHRGVVAAAGGAA